MAKQISHEAMTVYINNLKQRHITGTLKIDGVLRDTFFHFHVCDGSENEKKEVLKKILENGNWKQLISIKKTSNRHNKNSPVKLSEEEKKELNQKKWSEFFNQVVSYYQIIDKENIMLSELKLNTLEEVFTLFNIDISSLKKKYEHHVNELKKITNKIEVVDKYLNNQTKKIWFEKETKKKLTIESFSHFIGLDNIESKKLSKELNQLKIKRSQEKAKKLKEISIKEHRLYMQELKKEKSKDIGKIYSLLKNPLTSDVLKSPSLTIEELLNYFKINASKYQREIKRESLIARYCYYGGTMIHNMYVPDILKITKEELKKWKEQGKIKPSGSQAFHKWGKTLSSDLFEADYLSLITPEQIEDWRLEKKIKKNNVVENNIDKLISLIKETEDKGFIYKNNHWYCLHEIVIGNNKIKEIIKLPLKTPMDQYKKAQKLIEDLEEKKQLINTVKEEKKLIKFIDKYELTKEMKESLLKHLSFQSHSINRDNAHQNTINKMIEKYLKEFLDKRKKEQIIAELKVSQYEEGYPLARQMNRKIKIITGPTNSGKTYEALTHLMKAKSGVYLAPLRLLAIEIYDKLNMAGIACNLMTGEEKIIVPGAQHTASTIEMMDYNTSLEVAIIDEFQMLDDPQRGWAWTTAMVGVPAQTVYIIGNNKKLESAINLYRHLNEDYEVIQKERFTPLKSVPHLLGMNEFKKGDALIAFSRKDVLAYTTQLRDKGYKVSAIYGALAPEVRKRQAELFNTGENDILVSTDAIGMGLNLPIKRVIFAIINKFDGTMVRELTNEEFLQIAGRAGRYGMHEEGRVGLLNNQVNNFNILASMKKKLLSSVTPSLELFKIAPSNWHLTTISSILKTKDLNAILAYFSTLPYVNIYQTADLSHMRELYQFIKKDIKELSLQEQYKLIQAPIELHNVELMYFYKNLVSLAIQGEKIEFDIDYDRSLQSLEQCNKKLTIYCWLSFHYSNLDMHDMESLRNELTKQIEESLLREKNYGFTTMIQPFTQYNKRDDYDDDEY